MSKYLTKSVAATISALLLLGCAAPAFAADATVEKKETSYLILNADGSVQEQITSDWLHSDDGFLMPLPTKATSPISRTSRAT